MAGVPLTLKQRLAVGREPGHLWKGCGSCLWCPVAAAQLVGGMRSGCHGSDMILQKGGTGSEILHFSMTALGFS